MRVLSLLLILTIQLIVPTICFASEICQPPTVSTISSIKKILVDELGEQLNDDTKVTIEDVIIMQAYEKNNYIFIVYKYSRCFEGGIVLYRNDKNSIKEISSFNGYDPDGVFIGYNKSVVEKHFVEYLPDDIKAMMGCYQYTIQ